jgi:PAS domain S-box-containing protein
VSNRYDLPFDGGIYEVTTMPVRDGAGQIIAGAAIVRDVTLQRRVAGQMRRFETIVENAADTVIVYDLAGTIEYANPAAAALYGVEKATEFVGRPGTWAVAPEVAEKISRSMNEALSSVGVWRGRVWNELPSGKRMLLDAVSFLLFDERNQPTGAAMIARDVTNQVQEEDRRTEQQQQIIVGQQAALRELSTPLIPLADSVVVMPIIGTIDAQRAQQIMETLLEGIAANQAEIALLDISGVRVVDTQVADALLRAAKAANLLGTRIVLTGIKAEVAQTIVHLGADMREIVTRANLQEGLRYALDTVDNPMGAKV